jgi:spoIIIJ-associated protein
MSLLRSTPSQCTITGPHEAHIVGSEGRTLDSLQYLLRKMVARHLPDRIMLALNAGDFRERRAEELKIRAVELAELVKADGKTQAIPALNPSERRVVHMVLQEDKGVRSRSVGEGLFKKVLIYKPGKGRRPAAKKRRGGQGGRPSGD